MKTKLISFLTSVARGTWWTRLPRVEGSPAYYGANIVHVRVGSMFTGTVFAVNHAPSGDSMEMAIGASPEEIERIASALVRNYLPAQSG